MWFWKRKRPAATSFSAYKVFTPSTQAVLNFVPRDEIVTLLDAAFSSPGMQVVIYGESGSGKSTLLFNEIQKHYERFITTRCTSTSTFKGILMEAFDSLDQWVTNAKRQSSTSENLVELSASIAQVRGAVSGRDSTTSEVASSRLIDTQFTPQKLGHLLGKAGQCWVIEDFHKVPAAEKTALVQTLKVFSDMAYINDSIRIVVVGVSDSARDVVDYDSEMRDRVAEIYVPPMTDSELHHLLRRGGELMNISFAEVSDEIVRNSIGTASVTHQLALNCLFVMGIKRSQVQPMTVTRMELHAAAERYVKASSATLRSRFDKGLNRGQSTGYDNCRLILRALALSKVEGALHGDLLAIIRGQFPSYPSGNLTTYLRQLGSEARGSLVRKSLSGRFSFAEPLLHTYARLILVESTRSPSDDIFENVLKELTTKVVGRYDGSIRI